jgi:hypothetical protein
MGGNDQLDLMVDGLDEARRKVEAAPRSMRTRLLKQLETEHDLLSGLPAIDDLSFLHSGLCQTCLPHSRPASNTTPWTRTSGRFTLIVSPGVLDDRPMEDKLRQPTKAETEDMYVGVPYGSRARLIMIYLQTEGLKSRFVSLGPSMSAFLHTLGLPRSGGPRGSILSVREQCLRIARCQFTMQWTDSHNGGSRSLISDTRIVEGLELLNSSRGDWSGTVELSQKFHDHLREHAVPLDKRSIALVSNNSLSLDLYALFAYRLPRLRDKLHMPWEMLQSQIGTEYAEVRELKRKVSQISNTLRKAYRDAKFEIMPSGITLYPSPPAVPKNTMISGFSLVGEGEQS